MDQRDFQVLKTRIPGQVSEKVRETVEKLDRLWQTMGFSIDEKNERTDMITYHFNELAGKMLSEETEVLEKFEANIGRYQKEIDELNSELGNEKFEYSGPETLMQKENILSSELKSLSAQKEKRMVELFELKHKQQELCDKMLRHPVFVSSDKIPTAYDLELLRDDIKKLEQTRKTRWEEFRTLRREICQNYELIGEVPLESFSKEILTEEADSFMALNPDNLIELRSQKDALLERKSKRELEKKHYEQRIFALARRLKKSEGFICALNKEDLSEKWILRLKDEFEKLETEKFAKITELVQVCREEIANLWEKMYFNQEQRDEFVDFYSEDYSEALLTSHEEECRKLNDQFEQHRNMYKGIDQWTEMFAKYRKMKELEKDPDRFKNNRGGKLLKQQKEMALIKRKLPGLENQLIEDIEEWQKEHERVFLVDGVTFDQYRRSQWAAIEENEILEKVERNAKRKKQLAVDMVFGTVTPTKSKLGSTTDLSRMSKRSRIEQSVISAVSRLQIPAFNRHTPKRETPKKEPKKEEFAARKLRRRSKSAQNLLNPYNNIKSKVATGLTQFRTPQPARNAPSRLPRFCATDKKSAQKQKRPVQKVPKLKIEPIEENDDFKENSLDGFETAILQPMGGPTSIKSDPVFHDPGPLSYEDFGSGIDRRHARSSAIGTFGFNGCSFEH